jgi:hypothetical protein
VQKNALINKYERMNKKNLADEVYNIVNKSVEGSRPHEITVNIREEKKKLPLPPSIIVFQAAAFMCATKLTPSANRILMFFFSKSVYENFIGIDVLTLVEDLKVSKRSVINGLQELEDANIIIKIVNGQDRRRHDYFINPVAAWKGHSYSRNKQINKMKETKESAAQLNLFNIIPEDKKKAIKPSEDF